MYLSTSVAITYHHRDSSRIDSLEALEAYRSQQNHCRVSELADRRLEVVSHIQRQLERWSMPHDGIAGVALGRLVAQTDEPVGTG